MALRGQLLAPLLATALLPTAFLACRREDPQIRALTEKAAEADDAAQQLRQAWSEQFRRLSLARVKDLRLDANPMLLTGDQRRALESRVKLEKDSSRQGLLREILEKDGELQALDARLAGLKAALPAPEVARPNDSHYGLALRFLKSQGQSDAQARKALSQVAIADRLAPGFEVYHFFLNGHYGTWVSQGRASISPRDLLSQDPDVIADERDEVVAVNQRLQRELSLLEDQKQNIEQEIAAIQAERAQYLEAHARLQSENAQQLARLNSLHYLVGVRDKLESDGIIEVPLFGKAVSGRHWRDAVFNRNLDLRTGHSLVIQAKEVGLGRIGQVNVVPGSYLPGEHFRLILSADRQSVTVEFLALPRFKNDKVVFALAE